MAGKTDRTAVSGEEEEVQETPSDPEAAAPPAEAEASHTTPAAEERPAAVRYLVDGVFVDANGNPLEA